MASQPNPQKPATEVAPPSAEEVVVTKLVGRLGELTTKSYLSKDAAEMEVCRKNAARIRSAIDVILGREAKQRKRK